MAYLVVNCILQKLEEEFITRFLVPSCAGREDKLLVVSCTLDNLEKGLMTRSLVPSCAGREDRLLAVNCILENLEIDDKVPGAFVCREGRQVSGGELYLG